MDGIETIIQRIYEIQNDAIVSPTSLLGNAKLSNYSYVNYYRKNDDNLIVEMKCVCEDDITRVFEYIFDNDDKLLKIKATPGNILKTDILFDREIELKILINEYEEITNRLMSEKVG